MNKILRYSFVALLAMVGLNVSAQEVTLDFTTNAWQLPEGSGNKATAEASFSNGTYTIKLAAADGYYFNTAGYLMLGKSGSTLTLPAFSFDVERIDVVGNSAASASVKQNILVGEEAVSTETTGAQGTNQYVIAEGKQAAGTIYTLKVSSNHNTQITKVLIYKKGATPEPPTATVKYTKAASVEAGKRYMIAATKDSKLYAAKAVSGNYGYLQVVEVTDDNGVIMMTDDTNAFTFEAVTGGFKIKQNDGKYLYLDATHTSFQVAAETTEADIWTAVAQDNGTFKVNNVARNKYVQLDASYGTYGAYDTEKGSMPFLYLLDESTTGISTVKTVRVDDGAIYNLAGQKVDKSYKGVVIMNGKKMIQK